MIKLNFILIDKTALSSMTITAGNIYVCRVKSTYEYYYDANDVSRIKSTKFKYEPTCSSLEELKALVAHPTSTTIYITNDGGFFIYDVISSTWSSAEYINDISSILGIYDTLNAATAYGYDASGSKVNYAFKTVASAVYTEDGNTVENLLKYIRMTSTTIGATVCQTDGQLQFEIPYPSPFTKDTYLSQGNTFLVFMGTTLVDVRRYEISSDKSSIVLQPESTTKMLAGRSLIFLFIYNSKITSASDDVTIAIDGNTIVDNSVSITKLKSTTDSYNVNSTNTLVSSSALYGAVQYLLTKLAAVTPNKVVYGMTTGTGSAYSITISGFALTDGSFIHLKLNAPLLDYATLAVNGGSAIPIYKNYTDRILQTDVDTDSITVYYNETQNRFYICSGITYSLNTATHEYIAPTDGTAYIDIYTTDPSTGKITPIFNFDPFIDNLILYQDGIHLVQDVNYSFNIKTGRIEFLNYTLDAGTQIIFEVHYLEQMRSEARKINTEEIIGGEWTVAIEGGNYCIKYNDNLIFRLDKNSTYVAP